jgi:hypothetical protein
MGSFGLDTIFPNGLSVPDALDLIWPAGLYLLGMVVYAIFIFKFYRFVAARDMFGLDLSKFEESRYRWVRGILHFVMYVAKYIIVFPLFAIFWFAILTLILAFLAKEQAFPEILLIALVTVSAIRVTSYYKEDLSRDLAKILPFAVLGIFLLNASFFEISSSFNVLTQAKDHRESILYYLIFLIGLEFVLRLLMGIVALFTTIWRVLAEDEAAQVARPDFDSESMEQQLDDEEEPSAPVPSAPRMPSPQPSLGD